MISEEKFTKGSEKMPAEKKKWQFKAPNVFTLLLGIILVCAIMTYIIPAGQYEMVVNASGRKVADPESFQFIERTPIGILAAAAAPFNGLIKAGSIVFLVFICGGAFGVIMDTNSFQAALVRLALAMNGKEKLIVPILMIAFGIMGATINTAEDRIVYIPIVMSLCLAMGFDSMTAAMIVILGSNTGFTAPFINPYTVGVAQGIAELPLFSGMWFRVVMWLVYVIVSTAFVTRYALKVKKTPTISCMYEFDKTREEVLELDASQYPFGIRKKLICLSFLASIAYLGYGTVKLGWDYDKISALFFLLAVFAAVVDGMSANDFGKKFAAGMADIATGALVVGFARGILVVLESGNLIHTLLFFIANLLDGLPGIVCAEGMFLFQSLTNFIIPSGSGQAAVTMPLMTPLADIVGVTRQTAVTCFHLGDGISNAFTPTSGALMASLGMAKIPWDKWAKAVLPLIGLHYLLGMIFVAIAHVINLGPF